MTNAPLPSTDLWPRSVRSGRALGLISLAVLLASAVWFSGTAAAASLKEAWALSEVQASWLTVSVQIGFILGTFLYAIFNVADIFKARNVFFLSAVAGAVFNAAFALLSTGLASAVLFRFLTGITLAGVYPVGMKLIAQWERIRLGWGLGLMVGALTLGKAIPYLLFAVGADFDWRRLMVGASFLSAAGALIVKLGLGDGPHLQTAPPFDIHAAFRVFRRRDFRLQALGYFGHMWELYAFWSLAASYLAASFSSAGRPASPPIPLFVFLTIGIGAAGCVLGGWASRRYGERSVALLSLAGSFVLCALSGFIFVAPGRLLLPVMLVWGILVISDSPMFSSLAAQTCPPEYTGTALTIQNGIGFAITVVSILFIAWISRLVGWRWAFTFLAAGPLLGAVAMARLRKERRSTAAGAPGFPRGSTSAVLARGYKPRASGEPKARPLTLLLSIILSIALIPAGLMAQAEAKPVFGISFSGFVKTDLIYDSRQTVNLREGHYLLFPKGEALDKDGRDINAASSFHMLSIQTRLLGKIVGPDALGAKTSGLIEAEFFGTSDADINGFRLRHAYVKLNWPTTELLVGQFWHAMFITDSFPDVASFNTGAPFQPFSRAPQVRLTQQFGRFSLIATALAQRDFVSNGPDGASSAYARNAACPEVNLKAQYLWSGAGGRELLVGAGVDYKSLVPRLSTPAGYRTDAALHTWAGQAYFKYRTSAATLKAELIYGQDLHHLTMLGGYAVHEVTDQVKGFETYTPLDTVSGWVEVQTNGPRFQAGLFAGYSKNLGAKKAISGAAYARGADIAGLYRIAPRVLLNEGKLRLAAEVEWTVAAYGTPDGRGVVRDAKWIGNLRILGAVYYFF
jgi:MFS family permease